MTFLSKKWILLAFLGLVVPFNVSAGIEDDYKIEQQIAGECSYENAQFIDDISSFKYRYCINGGYWFRYLFSGSAGYRGVLDKYIESRGLIKKVKIEGDELVEYSCRGEFRYREGYIKGYKCTGPIYKEILGTKGRSYYTQKIKSDPNNYFYYHKRAIEKRNLITKNNGGIFKEKNDNLGMCEDYKKAAELEPKNMRDAKTYYKIFCEEFIKKDLKKDDQLFKKDQNPPSAYEKIAGYELEIRRLTQTIITHPPRSRLSDSSRSRLSDLLLLRGAAKQKLLETQLKRKLIKSDDIIGMCTDYKEGLALASKPSALGWNKSNNSYSSTKKILKEYCKLSFWESIKYAL